MIFFFILAVKKSQEFCSPKRKICSEVCCEGFRCFTCLEQEAEQAVNDKGWSFLLMMCADSIWLLLLTLTYFGGVTVLCNLFMFLPPVSSALHISVSFFSFFFYTPSTYIYIIYINSFFQVGSGVFPNDRSV